MNDEALRHLAAGATVLAYAALCLGVFNRERQRATTRARTAAALAGPGDSRPTLVLYGSQTGQAETIAQETASWIHQAGDSVRVLPLNEVDVATLNDAQRALFIASTYGEGDAPDGASVFAERVMGAPGLQLSSLRFAVLALGDRQYANFCGFGRALDAWLAGLGASRELDRIDVDNSDPAALASWRALIGGGDAAQDTRQATAPPTAWRLAAREILNPGSAGTPVFHLTFAPPAGETPYWESGDIAQVNVNSDPVRPRDYSISSIPGDGTLQLLVRQEQHADGTLGAASGLLTSTLAIGDSIALRLRPNRNFRLGDNATRPLILIGNGTGIAGLRSHLRARAKAGQRDNWLLFGERNAQHDFLYRPEIEAWLDDGVLRRLDMVFSRDQQERAYVQHRLLHASEEVAKWIERGAAIYVCGSLQGMASGVDAALRQIAGHEQMQALSAEGRYRRDVY